MRTAVGRGLVAAAALAAVAVTAACGGGDSTVSATPSTAAPTEASSAETTSAEPTETGDEDRDKDDEDEADGDELPESIPPETPVELPEDYPGPQAPELSERDQGFLDALGEAGVEYSGDGEIAINAANLVCAAEEGHYDEMQMRAFVLAIVSSDAQILGKEVDGAAITETYIDTARKAYC